MKQVKQYADREREGDLRLGTLFRLIMMERYLSREEAGFPRFGKQRWRWRKHRPAERGKVWNTGIWKEGQGDRRQVAVKQGGTDKVGGTNINQIS